MTLKALAETVIIQSAKDIVDKQQRVEAVEFFAGEGFRMCSVIAEIDHSAQQIILNLIRRRITLDRLLRQNDNFHGSNVRVGYAGMDTDYHQC